MLIQRLVEYASRQIDQGPRYYRQRSIRWALRLDPEKNEVGLLDLAEDGKSGPMVAAPYLTRTSGVAAMLLVDTLEYVLGIPKDDSDKAHTGAETRRAAYLDLLRSWRDESNDPNAHRLVNAFESGLLSGIAPPEEARPKSKPSDLVMLMIGNQRLHDLPSTQSFWAKVAKERKNSGNNGLCLSCGEIGPLLKTVPDMVKSSLIPVGVDSGGRPKRGRDAALVSVNTTAQGRMGLLQLVNTPLCEGCGGQAVAALNTLLADERHRRKGDDSVLTWWLRNETRDLPMRLIERPEPTDVKALLDSVNNAKTNVEVDPNAFYAVTLSANQSRVVVRDWLELPVSELKENLALWFLDHASVDVWQDDVHYVPLWQMIRASGRWDKNQKRYAPGSAVHGLERGLLRSAMRKEAPPPQLVPRLLHRIRNDHHIDLARVSMLRLALRRPPYAATTQDKEKTMPGLDEKAVEPAYVWGRVFAVLEEIQHQAIPNINATIRDRYFGLAMTQPAPTLVQLRQNANSHLKKLVGREGTRPAGRALQGRLTQIIALFDQTEGVPPTLTTTGQVQFVLGYDHQRAADMAAKRAGAAAKAARAAAPTESQES